MRAMNKGQATIEYIAMLTLLMMLFIGISLDILTTAMGAAKGAETDILLKKLSKELTLAVEEAENMKTVRHVILHTPQDCEITVAERYVTSMCEGERRILVTTRHALISLTNGVIKVEPE